MKVSKINVCEIQKKVDSWILCLAFGLTAISTEILKIYENLDDMYLNIIYKFSDYVRETWRA